MRILKLLIMLIFILKAKESILNLMSKYSDFILKMSSRQYRLRRKKLDKIWVLRHI